MRFVENFYQIGKEIHADMKKIGDRLGAASVEAIQKTQTGLKMALRDQIRNAGLGNRLPNTWRDSNRSGQKLIYPKGKYSPDAAGIVFSAAPDVIASFDKGLTIRTKDGRFLAIPTENVPPGNRGRRLTPRNWPSERLGPLHMVKKRDGTAMLVTDASERQRYQTTKVGGKRVRTGKLVNAGKRAAFTVMFILVPQVQEQKKFDVGAEARKWLSEMARLFDQALSRRKL